MRAIIGGNDKESNPMRSNRLVVDLTLSETISPLNEDEAARRQLMNLRDERKLSFDNFKRGLENALADVSGDASHYF